MLYRPKYCCNCGETIERDDWRLWTSRRFCALCETEYKPYDLLPRAIVFVGLAFVLFGIGSYFRSPEPGLGPQVSTKSARPSHKLKSAALLSTPEGNANVDLPVETVNTAGLERELQIDEQPKKEKRTSDEVVFYCRAITKKGSPCTRRVKKQGFCWQHAKSSQIAPARF